MVEIDKLSVEQFKKLPLVIEGESKEVRYGGEGLVVIKFKPTIYSFTANRTGVVEDSDKLRLRASKAFLEVLREAGIDHTYRQVNDNWVLSDLVLEPETDNNNPFRPTDLTPGEIDKLSVAPPIETIVKRYHSGTSKHRYYRMDGYSLRKSHPFYPGYKFGKEDAYPATIVRFDWRNPLMKPSPNNPDEMERAQDEVMCDDMASWYLDIKEAKQTALEVSRALTKFLGKRDVTFYDLCLFITEDGKRVFGEISQDCGRFRHFNYGELDKDVWRAGGSSEVVIQKWQTLLDLIEK